MSTAADDNTQADDSGFASVVSAIKQLQNEDRGAAFDTSTISADDNSSIPFEIPPEKEAGLIELMRQHARKNDNLEVANADLFWLLVCLRARKGDVERATALAGSYLQWRREFKCEEHTPANSDTIRRIFEEGMFVFAGNRSRDGRYVFISRYGSHDMKKFSTVDQVRAVGFLHEWMLRTYPRISTHGLVVVEDHNGFSFRKIDMKLMDFMTKAFSKTLPTRLSAIHIVNPPWLVKFMMMLFGGFFSDKLKTRFRVTGRGNVTRFREFFDPEQTPKFLNMGGTLDWTEDELQAWIEQMIEDSKKW